MKHFIYAKDANTGVATVEYNLNDQPTAIQTKMTRQTASYDKAGRLLTAKHCKLGTNNQTTSSSCEKIQYTYNGAHLIQITDPTQTTSYSYDTEGRLTVESVHFKDSDKQWNTSYQYDETGRLFKVGLPEGATLTYQYNDISNPVTVSYQAPAQGWFERLIRKVNPEHNSQALISDIQSDSIRGLISFTHSNGQTAKAEYDKAGRLTTWQDGDYQKELTYDKDSLITGMQSRLGDQRKSETLNYNAFGELISIKDDKAQSNQYRYDLNGNRLAYSTSAGQAKYEYEVNTDRLLSITQNNSTHHYQHDAAGNPTLISTQDENSQTKEQHQFSYGARGQLIQYKDDKGNPTNYRYNHAMQRVSKRTSQDDSNEQEQRYLWQQGLLDAEIDVRKNKEHLKRRYIYVGLRPIAVIDYDSDNLPSIYSIHTDHLGTPQQVSNDNQQIVWQGEYDAFGNVTVKAISLNTNEDIQARGFRFSLINQANASNGLNSIKPFEFNLRFAGQYEDSESGYYYNWHRYYDPKTGRYLTSDPIGLNGGLNTYGYAGQNPISAVDPWGLFTKSQFQRMHDWYSSHYKDSNNLWHSITRDKIACINFHRMGLEKLLGRKLPITPNNAIKRTPRDSNNPTLYPGGNGLREAMANLGLASKPLFSVGGYTVGQTKNLNGLGEFIQSKYSYSSNGLYDVYGVSMADGSHALTIAYTLINAWKPKFTLYDQYSLQTFNTAKELNRAIYKKYPINDHPNYGGKTEIHKIYNK